MNPLPSFGGSVSGSGATSSCAGVDAPMRGRDRAQVLLVEAEDLDRVPTEDLRPRRPVGMRREHVAQRELRHRFFVGFPRRLEHPLDVRVVATPQHVVDVVVLDRVFRLPR